MYLFKFFLFYFFSKIQFVSSKPSDSACFNNITVTILTQIFKIDQNESNSVIQDLEDFTVSPDDIKFLLYSPSSNKFNPLDHVNSSNPTKIIIVGWQSDPEDPWVVQMAADYTQKQKCNVLSIDWTKHSSGNYVHAAVSTHSVGNIVGDFIVKVLGLAQVHIIGHSLGAQVGGFAGKRVTNKTRTKIDRVTGLDPAGPLFETPIPKGPDCRIARSDASFVDIIHTQMGTRGIFLPYGHVDFYVNGGFVQPECIDELPDLDDAISCGHQSAHWYFAKTILQPKSYRAVQCDDLASYTSGGCINNKKVYMGEGVSRNASGQFYISIDEDGDAEEMCCNITSFV